MESIRRSVWSGAAGPVCASTHVAKRTIAAMPMVRRTRRRSTQLSALHFAVKLLKHKESLLFLPMFGYQTFAIEVILNSRKRASRAAKVFQNPRCGSTQKGNAFQHGNLVLIEIFLIFLTPASEGITMVAKSSVAAEFAHDERLIILRGPVNLVRVRDRVSIPANIFIVPQHIEIVRDGVLNADLDAVSLTLLMVLQSGGYQTRRISGVGVLNELPQKAVSRFVDRCLIGHGINDQSGP